ncbi:nucleoside 2-deoxyribosyltransferase [Methanocella arvoryzae]|uniref:Nucleoside 2-deoxyribosyltransferase n=1 Tax=Methanocella arvoryzae (strain DSM 22066 / NBRC 105507 / MRE50) TaxID=351160 RepID=Q0W5K4_METAR|nr:nucleoside 2-deoxyribosyltransferase [Methanocella arvoryzae]CAJ36339.2 putative nucleoside 2-deoxyribosyltransferase [Methanocella arvoryzae MRE50]
MRLFLAGPFFDDEEVERLDKVKARLEDLGFEVYSTSHRNQRIDLRKPEEKSRRFRLLCEEIRRSDGVFAVLDGRDAGTIWEMGYAFSAGKPVIAFAEEEGFFSLMIDQSATYLVGFDSLDRRLYEYLQARDINSTPKYTGHMVDDY